MLRTMQTFLTGGPFPAVFIVLSILLYILIKSIRKETTFIIAASLSLTIGAVLTVATFMGYSKVSYKLSSYLHPRERIFFLYDTDPRNNDFIKANLQPKQLKILDQLLELEKKQSGLRLTPQDINKITRYNSEVKEAYDRWRKCKDMMRSSYRVVYPDERKFYIDKGGNIDP